MLESKIYAALADYKTLYAWDKSLNSSETLSLSPAPPLVKHSSSYLDDFISATQAAAQQDRGF